MRHGFPPLCFTSSLRSVYYDALNIVSFSTYNIHAVTTFLSYLLRGFAISLIVSLTVLFVSFSLHLEPLSFLFELLLLCL